MLGKRRTSPAAASAASLLVFVLVACYSALAVATDRARRPHGAAWMDACAEAGIEYVLRAQSGADPEKEGVRFLDLGCPPGALLAAMHETWRPDRQG